MEEKKDRLQMAKRILEKHANWFLWVDGCWVPMTY